MIQDQDGNPPRRWMALCDVCYIALREEVYQAAEDQAPPGQDPACPRCGKQLWSFHPEEDLTGTS